jgi:hypothetical protein
MPEQLERIGSRLYLLKLTAEKALKLPGILELLPIKIRIFTEMY